MTGIKSQKRDYVLDVLKGLGIMLVVFGHTYIGTLVHFVYLFHMPLFFIAAGCLFALGKGGTIKGKLRRLIIPYTFFSILCYLYWWLIESQVRRIPESNPFDHWLPGLHSYAQQLINIPLALGGDNSFEYNVVLWFLPCLFVSYLIYIPLSQCKPKVQILAGVGLYLIFGLIHKYLPTLPWYSDIALVGVTFFIIGRFGYDYMNRAVKSTPWAIIIFVVSCLSLYIIAQIDGMELDFKSGTVPKFWWLYSAPLLGFVMAWCIAYIIKEHGWRLRDVFVWLGTNSLLIMCLHEPIKRVMIRLFQVLMHCPDRELMHHNIWISLLLTISIILICYPMSIAITKWMPWAVGQPRHRK